MNSYYILWFQIDHLDLYSIWYSNDRDGFVVNEDKKIYAFRSLSDLHTYANSLDLSISEEQPILHNIDTVQEWTENAQAHTINCKDFLAAWNLFSDITSSVADIKWDENSELTKEIYEKLFLGNNLPAVSPTEEDYIPVWTETEMAKLQEILSYGLKALRKHIAVIS